MSEVRIQKFLSQAGVASRREAERLMADGRVSVNGRVVRELGTRVKPSADRVEVDGKRVRTAGSRWILLNKPRGVITSRSDPRGRRTIYRLLSPEDQGLKHVGRLDRDTEGLLLLTNDGDLHHALLHPSREIPRRYRALVLGIPDEEAVHSIGRGVALQDGLARADDVRLERILDRDHAVVALTMKEGRRREVRRLLEAVGHPVERLKRVAFGPITLGRLAPGRTRPLTDDEVARLRQAVEPRRARGGKEKRAPRAPGDSGAVVRSKKPRLKQNPRREAR
jgi:23S rRNA pseudouridine2605 synthase